jgi:ABC-2 type transport system ATP-binding protein
VSPASPPILSVDGLTKHFPRVTAIDAMSFSVAPGEVFGLVGPDGAGKTTTLRVLAGVLSPDAGKVMVDGIDVGADPEAVKERVSYMPQRFGLYEDLTVDENIRFYADLFGIARRVREERSARLLAASGMTEFRGRLAGQLSGGMKQKLGLTCSLIHTPRILLLDEPTTGVDPVSRRDFWRILYSLREEGVTILVATAYLDEAERCTRLALLHNGRMMYCDSPAALKQHMPGTLVEIATDSTHAARDALLALEGVSSARVVGDGVHAVVDDARRRIPAIRRALEAAGIAFGRIAAEPPSMEDLFVALLQNERPPK